MAHVTDNCLNTHSSGGSYFNNTGDYVISNTRR